MIEKIKIPFLRKLRAIKERLWEKKIVFLEGGKLDYIRGKEKINVVFIIVHQATWKFDRLYSIMADNPKIHPTVLVAPASRQTAELNKLEIQMCHDYFKKNNIEYVVGSLDDVKNKLMIEKIAPDIVIFNNPHGLTSSSLHRDLFSQYLSCYIPYHIEVGRYSDDFPQYNRVFHNTMWKIFSPHRVSLETFKKVARRKARNVVVTGYPGLESLCGPIIDEANAEDPWKPLGLKRIIWAPHHTIEDPKLPYSNFLRYAEHFKSLVEDYSDRIQWCFKPHPLLKQKLMQHTDWGQARTEEYFEFWRNHSNTQTELGDYSNLFRQSDALIHDSGSFLAEYIYVEKPVMYLWSSSNVVNFFNKFGLDALYCCERGDNENDIRKFIESVLEGRDNHITQRQEFLSKYPVAIDGLLPSDRILKTMVETVWVS